jgi:PAB1-binding protein PBP1
MITASNYFIEVERIGVNTLPETLQKGHDLVVKSTSNGANWANYQSSEGIKKVIDLYFQKLNDFASTLKPKESQPTKAKTTLEPKKKPATEKSKERNASPKKVKEKKEPKHVKHVESISEKR